jgi:plasmid stability protein
MVAFHNRADSAGAGTGSAEATMPNLTIKGIPQPVYERLKARAKINHRSLNAEVIACLEHAVLPQRVSPDEMLARAAAARSRVKGGPYSAKFIADAIREGRE